MKQLRNLLRAILWVWGIAFLAGFIVIAIVEKSWMIGTGVVVLTLCAITLIVYQGLNGDL